MKCSFCDQQLSDQDKYCPNCGSKVDIPPEKQSDKEPSIVSESPPLVIKSTKNKKMSPKIIAGLAAALLILVALAGYMLYGSKSVPGGEEYQKAMEYLRFGDRKNGVEWLNKGIKKGDIEAMYMMGVLENENADMRSFKTEMYEMAAKKGHVKAMYELGIHYRDWITLGGTNEQALDWLTKAAQKGHTEAMLQLGEMYESGEWNDSDESNIQEALKWYKKAAEAGSEEAQAAIQRAEQREDETNGDEDSEMASGGNDTPQTFEDLPQYALELVQNGYFNSYGEGYDNIYKAFSKKFDTVFKTNGKWEIPDEVIFGAAPNLVLKISEIAGIDGRRLSALDNAVKTQANLALDGQMFDNYPIFKVKYSAIGPNMRDKSVKAKYEVVFKVKIYTTAPDHYEWECYAYMNGREINAGDFLAFIYLN